MSPESLGLDGGEVDLDTRTDVYALGVVLYELLAGVRPVDVTGGSVAQIVKWMMSEDTVRLSLRVAALEQGEGSAVANNRGLAAHALPRRLSGDLDWITARATARERDQRYGSAAELAEDIERHLSHEPVNAGPASLSYRLGKLARRHRAAAVAAVVAVLALAIGIVGLTTGMVRARQEADNAKQTVELLQEFFSSVDPKEKGRELKVVELVEAFKPRLEELDDRPAVQASLFSTYGRTYAHLGLYDEAYTYHTRAYDLRKRVLGKEHPDTLITMSVLARVLLDQGKSMEAEQMLRQCLEIQKRTLGEDHPKTCYSMKQLARAFSSQDKHAEAEILRRQVLELRKRVLGEENPNTIHSMNDLAETLRSQGKHSEAEALYRRVLELRKRALGEENPGTLDSMNRLAWYFAVRGENLEEAETLARLCVSASERVFGADHRTVAGRIDTLATILEKRNKRVEAIEWCRKAAKGGVKGSQEALERLGEEW